MLFLKILFCSQSLNLFDPKYSKNSNIVKYFYDNISIWIILKK